MTLAATFMRVGIPCQIVKVFSPGAKKKETLLDQMMKSQDMSSKEAQVAIVAADGEQVAPQVNNGSRDKLGKIRANVGGRPRKFDAFKRGVEGSSAESNRLQAGEKARRFELPGPVQLEVVQKIADTAEKFASTPAAATMFWKEILPQFPDIPKKRLKKWWLTKQKLQPELGN